MEAMNTGKGSLQRAACDLALRSRCRNQGGLELLRPHNRRYLSRCELCHGRGPVHVTQSRARLREMRHVVRRAVARVGEL